MQDRKPPSFLAKNEEYLMELTKQVLITTRQSIHNRKSIGVSRISNKLNTLDT